MEKRDRFSSRRRFAGNPEETVDVLAETLREELESEDFQNIEENDNDACEADDAGIIAEAEAFINSLEAGETEQLPDNQQIIGEEAEEKNFNKECAEVESMIDAAEEEAEAASVLAECEAVEASIRDASERTASIYKKGIEDDIRDTGSGLEKTVSELPNTKIKTDTRKDVFGKGTNSAYVASITSRLDRVASILEKRGDIRMAFRVDRLADALEQEIKKH